jgi:hypothetical protein
MILLLIASIEYAYAIQRHATCRRLLYLQLLAFFPMTTPRALRRPRCVRAQKQLHFLAGNTGYGNECIVTVFSPVTTFRAVVTVGLYLYAQ